MTSRATVPAGEQGHGFDERVSPYSVQMEPTETAADVDLLTVLKHLWRSRWFVIVAAVAGLLLALAALFALRTVGPAEISYNSAIVVTFPDRESGKYPNGVAYSPTDLLSPAVLSEVHDRNRLDDAGVPLTAFTSYVTVSPYSPLADSLVARYRQRLSDRNASFEERRAIEADFGEQLAALSRNGVLITLQLPVTSSITADMAQKILADIPAVWSDIYVNRLGVVTFGVPVSGSTLVDRTLLGSLDYPLQFDYIEGQIEKASVRVNQVSALPGADTALSTESGKSVSDLRRDLDALGEFVVARVLEPIINQGISRTPEQTALSYRQSISQLRLKQQSSEARARAVAGVLKDVDSQAGQVAATGAQQPTIGAAPTMTQIDGSLVDRIIALSSQGSEFGYRRELLGDKLTIENTGIDVSDSIARISARIQAIEALATSGALAQDSVEVFEGGVQMVATTLDTIWDETNSLHRQLGAEQLNPDKLLYRPMALEEDKRISQPSPLSIWTIGFAVALTLVGAMLGFLVYLSRVKAKPAG